MQAAVFHIEIWMLTSCFLMCPYLGFCCKLLPFEFTDLILLKPLFISSDANSSFLLF